MTTFSDDFTRADAGTLGVNWTDLVNGHDISGNLAAPESAATCMTIWTAACDTDDNFSQVTVTTVAGTAISVVFRTTDASNWYRFIYNGTTLQLAKFVAGVLTAIGSAHTVTLTSGDVIKGQAVGTVIKGFLNGNEVCSTTDSGLATGKKVGIRGSSTSVRLSDWSGGDVAAPLPPGPGGELFLPAGAMADLAAPIDADDTVLTIRRYNIGMADWPVAGVSQARMIIRRYPDPSETVILTAVSGLEWTVVRGADGTTASAHPAGARIEPAVTPGGVAAVIAE